MFFVREKKWFAHIRLISLRVHSVNYCCNLMSTKKQASAQRCVKYWNVMARGTQFNI